MCDSCKKAGRKDYKVIHSARQQANAALGERAGFTGTIWLGELEIPENFRNPHGIKAGRLDVMRSNWESFSLENGHLPVHELEREWASKFGTFDVGLNTGVCTQQLSKPASTLGRPVSEGVCIGVNEEVSQNPHQQIHCKTDSSTTTRDCTIAEDETSECAHRHVQYNEDSTTKRANSTTVEREASQSTYHQPCYSISSDTDKTNITPAGEAASRHIIYHQPRSNKMSNIDKRTTTTRDNDREAHYKSTLITRSSSSQSTRARPWDL